MELQRLYVDISRVVFGNKSYIENHVLYISKHDLEAVVADPAFSKIEFETASPGESCRIINMGDIVQPTIKLGDNASTFPGVVDKVRASGRGTSLMLRGVVVSETAEVPVQHPSLIETTELGAEKTDFATMIHVVIDALPADGVGKDKYLEALHVASKRVAKFLASLATELPPDGDETFSLSCDNLEGLPKVAYLAGLFCHAPLCETTVYGSSMFASLPTILHPNEILDGAITNKNYENSINADPTYVWQNHPIILDLYRRHGKDVNFVGVVLSNVHHVLEEKERNASMAAALIAVQLKADGVIITKEGGGHPQVDVMLTTNILEEEYGVKTSILFAEFLSPNNDANGQLLMKNKYATAIVSTGCVGIIELPEVNKVIGHMPVVDADFKAIKDSAGRIRIKDRALNGCESQLGWTRFGSQKF